MPFPSNKALSEQRSKISFFYRLLPSSFLPEPAILQQIREHASLKYPREVCGVYFQKKNGSYASEAFRNRSSSDQAFYADPLDLLSLLEREERGELSIAAFYHSHPNQLPQLSQEDITWLMHDGRYLFPNIDIIIISVWPSSTSSFALYRPNNL